MLTYRRYKEKHDWATQNIATFEGRLADGRARLEATQDELKIAENEHHAAAQTCLEKPATEVTPAEWAKVESSYQQVTELRDKCDAIEQDNGLSERGIEEAKEFRSELEAQYPEHHEQQLSEQSQEAPDNSDMSRTATGFQAYAGLAAVAVSLNTSAPEMPSNIEMARAVDPAAHQKQEAGELDCETMPTSQRDQMRDVRPLEDSPFEQHPPEPPPPVAGPSDDIPPARAETPLLTYDKADQKQLTYEEPKLITDPRNEDSSPTNEAASTAAQTKTTAEAQVSATAPPAPDDSVPPPAPEPTTQQPTGPSL
jgi:hypothetical protein